DVPDRCERVHLHRDEPREYLGFISLRPLLGAPVSRTVLAPPPDMMSSVAAKTVVHAHPWGRDEAVVGFPYISQDRQLGRCAHADIWMIAMYHHHEHRARRTFLSEIVEAAKSAPAAGRLVPSGGLSLVQVSAAFREIGLPAVHYPLDDPPIDE